MTFSIHVRLVLILMTACHAALAQTYQPAPSPVPARVASIVGDFDGDGFRDLLDLPGLYKGDGNGNFLPRQVLPLTGAVPVFAPSASSAVADFDGNGYDDLIVRSNSSSLAAYAFGPGGAVQVPLPPGVILGFTLADALYRVVAADLDSDGLTDFVVTSLGPGPTLYFGVPGQPRAFRNLGGGSFAAFPLASLTTAATHTFVVDADGDGRLDIVVLQDPAMFGVTPSASIVVIRQDAPGTFNSVVASNVSVAPSWLDAAIGDVDGDGLPDLYVSREGTSTLFLNAGGCAFAPGVPGLTSAARQVEVRLLDVNQDGDAELVTFENGDRISVHDFVNGAFVGPIQVLGPALETLGLPTTVSGARPTAADVDLDGRVDIVSFTTGLMLNDGHGGFRQVVDRLALGIDSGVHRLADLDGDGFPDILAVVRRRLSVGLNDGAGRWALAAANVPVLPAVTNDSVSFTQPFDFDGDGDLDLYFANTSSSVPALAGPDLVLRNDGNLTWSSLFTRPSYGDVKSILALDLDGDQDQDLVLVRSSTANPPLTALINAGGTSLVSQTLWQPNSQILGCVAFDMESDGDLDLFVTTTSVNQAPPVLQTTVLVNSGNGSFTPLAGFPQVGGTRPFAADFDGDGLIDLLAGGTVVRNAGGGNFTANTIWAPGSLVVPRGVTDVDHDGDLDLVLTLSSELRIFGNDGAGGFTLVESSPYLGAEYPALPAAMDLDRDGDVDIDYHLFDVSHQLARKTSPRIGRPTVKRLSAAPGTGFSLFLSLGRNDQAIPPYGTLFLDLSSAVQMAQGVTGANATADVSILVPNLPTLVGLSVYWQALFWDGPRVSGMEASVVGW